MLGVAHGAAQDVADALLKDYYSRKSAKCGGRRRRRARCVVSRSLTYARMRGSRRREKNVLADDAAPLEELERAEAKGRRAGA